MYRAQIEKRPNAIIPDPQVRVSNARRSLVELADVKQQLANVEAELSGWATKTLRPFSYSGEYASARHVCG